MVPPNHQFQFSIGFFIINHPFWGTPIFGNTQVGPKTFQECPLPRGDRMIELRAEYLLRGGYILVCVPRILGTWSSLMQIFQLFFFWIESQVTNKGLGYRVNTKSTLTVFAMHGTMHQWPLFLGNLAADLMVWLNYCFSSWWSYCNQVDSKFKVTKNTIFHA